MKVRKEEFLYRKCPVCGERISPKESYSSSLLLGGKNQADKITCAFHKECYDKIIKALDEDMSVSFDMFSHRVIIESEFSLLAIDV